MSGFLSGGGGVLVSTVVASPNGVLAGFLECDGSTLSRAIYAGLFEAIGEKYGAGDGSTTFAIPDLRGEFIRGLDNGRGVDVGRVEGSGQTDLFKAHNHNVNTNATNGNSGGGSIYNSVGSATHLNTTSVLSTGGNETRPRNIAMTYCIKY